VAYVYRHIRLDKNEPFYIGVGKNDKDLKRAFSKSNRNNHWKEIIEETSYKVEILLNNLTIEDAFKKEIFFINIYKKIKDGGTLCNISNGGRGGSLSDEVNEKRKNKLLGHFVSDETKQKIREKSLGRIVSLETKKKMSETHKKNKTGHWLESKGHKNSRAFPVYQFDINENFIKKWDCANYAIKELNMNRTSITDCLKKRQKTAKGFIWKKTI
jgi:hypothetical protein